VIGFTRVDRYVAGHVLRGYAVVAGVLLALFSLLAFREELESVGESGYDTLRALWFVGMTTPARVLRLLPFITLFGTALALWQLAQRSELVILRAAGMNLVRIAIATLVPGLGLLVLTPLAHEFVAPVLYAGATLSRDVALGRADEIAGRGFWSRSGQTLIEVGSLEHGRVPVDVRIYQLAPDAGVEEIITAASADPDVDGAWRLVDATRRRFDENGVAIELVGPMRWRPWWADDTFLHAPPVDSLSFTDLAGYIDYLKGTGQPSSRWQLAYWRMWMLPVSALLTGLLAVPIALSTQRRGSLGYVALALAGGLVYFLGDQIVGNAGLVAGIPPVAVALMPPIILALIVTLVLRRAY
jgi:lipopolysaccharide export system permease protein